MSIKKLPFLVKFALVLIVGALIGLWLQAIWPDAAQEAPEPTQQGTQPAGDPPLQQQQQRMLFPEPLGRMAGVRLHACPYEDGDPNTRPCVWTHPRTHVDYYVSSVEYTD